MYSLLMVEDEPIEMKALDKMVRSLELDIGPIWQAKNGGDALELARAQQPDVLLMDINIPGMNGLEVIDTLRNEGYAGAAIVLTAYNRFEYAKSAIHVRVMDYLLKPVDSYELRTCLESAFESLESASNRLSRIETLQNQVDAIRTCVQPNAMQALLNADSSEEMMRSLYGWPPDGQLQAYMLRLAFGEDAPQAQRDALLAQARDILSLYFCIVDCMDGGGLFLALQALKEGEPDHLDLVVWCASMSLSRLARELALSCTLFASRRFARYGDFRQFRGEYDPPRRAPSPALPLARAIAARLPIPMRELRTRQAKALLRMRAGTPAKALGPFRSLLADSKTCWLGAYCVLDMLLEYDPDIDLFDALSHLQPAAVSASLGRWLEEALAVRAGPATTELGSFAIQHTLATIESGYMNPFLSQLAIAERLGLSQAYFSRLFKKETGMTFIAKLTETRLERAKALLKQGHSPAQTASACGYQSVKYFGAAFRQYTGMSVAQYQEELSRA